MDPAIGNRVPSPRDLFPFSVWLVSSQGVSTWWGSARPPLAKRGSARPISCLPTSLKIDKGEEERQDKTRQDRSRSDSEAS